MTDINKIPDLVWTERDGCYTSRGLALAIINKRTNFTFVEVGTFSPVYSDDDEFKNLDEAKAWANEQYKQKVSEVLGL